MKYTCNNNDDIVPNASEHVKRIIAFHLQIENQNLKQAIYNNVTIIYGNLHTIHCYAYLCGKKST